MKKLMLEAIPVLGSKGKAYEADFFKEDVSGMWFARIPWISNQYIGSGKTFQEARDDASESLKVINVAKGKTVSL